MALSVRVCVWGAYVCTQEPSFCSWYLHEALCLEHLTFGFDLRSDMETSGSQAGGITSAYLRVLSSFKVWLGHHLELGKL